MARIFLILAIVALAMMALTIGVGWSLGDLKGQLLEGRELAAEAKKLESGGTLTATQQATRETTRSAADRAPTFSTLGPAMTR